MTNGKGAMPAWGDRLDEEEIEAVANYVFEQATNNKWEGGWGCTSPRLRRPAHHNHFQVWHSCEQASVNVIDCGLVVPLSIGRYVCYCLGTGTGTRKGLLQAINRPNKWWYSQRLWYASSPDQ